MTSGFTPFVEPAQPEAAPAVQLNGTGRILLNRQTYAALGRPDNVEVAHPVFDATPPADSGAKPSRIGIRTAVPGSGGTAFAVERMRSIEWPYSIDAAKFVGSFGAATLSAVLDVEVVDGEVQAILPDGY